MVAGEDKLAASPISLTVGGYPFSRANNLIKLKKIIKIYLKKILKMIYYLWWYI